MKGRERKANELNDLFAVAAALIAEIQLLPDWHRILFEGEIRRIKERERILREMGKYEYSGDIF